MAHSATSTAKTTKWYCWDIYFIVGNFFWLVAKRLKIPPPLSHKLAVYFVGLFPILHTIGPVFFYLQLPDDWDIHNMFYKSWLMPAVVVVDALATPFHLEANDSGEFKVQDILDSFIVNLHG